MSEYPKVRLFKARIKRVAPNNRKNKSRRKERDTRRITPYTSCFFAQFLVTRGD